ncbi:MAG: SDR family NAD(P)-dependent oxidoreductase [Acidimicrobiales bacterium]
MTVDCVVDTTLETLVVPSFTRVGYDVRGRIHDWAAVERGPLESANIVVTGATSGLGLATVEAFSDLGARVFMLGRDESKTSRVRDQLMSQNPARELEMLVADMGNLDEVAAACAQVEEQTDRLSVLVHNAGALSSERTMNAAGIESTVASQVLGPHLMTTRLVALLGNAGPGLVLTMASGGMYVAPLSVSNLQMDPNNYKGSMQYALAKRAQVTLTEMWAERVAAEQVMFHSLHPGWVDTPGVRHSLPLFATAIRPLLRTPDQGIDTLVWLAAADRNSDLGNGCFWFDRAPRPIHRLGRTRRSDTPERRGRLLDWVNDAAGTTSLWSDLG